MYVSYVFLIIMTVATQFYIIRKRPLRAVSTTTHTNAAFLAQRGVEPPDFSCKH